MNQTTFVHLFLIGVIFGTISICNIVCAHVKFGKFEPPAICEKIHKKKAINSKSAVGV